MSQERKMAEYIEDQQALENFEGEMKSLFKVSKRCRAAEEEKREAAGNPSKMVPTLAVNSSHPRRSHNPRLLMK